jgi:dienelactone hydrolase
VKSKDFLLVAGALWLASSILFAAEPNAPQEIASDMAAVFVSAKGLTTAWYILSLGKAPWQVEKADATVTIANPRPAKATVLDPNGMHTPTRTGLGAKEGRVIRFLRANAEKYSLDVDRIGVWGGSSGGHLAALLGTSGGVRELEGDVGGNIEFSSRVQCVVDCSGPTDLARLEATCGHIYAPGQSPPATLVGGPTKEHMDLVKMANPVTYIAKDCPPFLIFHGDKDNLVPPEQSEFLVAALKKAGVDVTFETIKGVGHGGGTAAQIDHLNRTVLAFFDKHLKGAAAAAPHS